MGRKLKTLMPETGLSYHNSSSSSGGGGGGGGNVSIRSACEG